MICVSVGLSLLKAFDRNSCASWVRVRPNPSLMFQNLSAGDLCVAHITDEGLDLLEPLRVTQTHVFVNVSHLSAFGILEKIWDFFMPRPKRAQVLLFLRPTGRKRRILNVFLLPGNVAPKEVTCCLLNSFYLCENEYI